MHFGIRASNFLRAFRFPVYLISGYSRHGGGNLRLIYAGNTHLRHYIKQLAFVDSPDEKYVGKLTLPGLRRFARQATADIELCRSHVSLVRAGLFPHRLFVPDWLSGTTDLLSQAEYEKSSKSLRRDRRYLERNNVRYTVTRNEQDLRLFYDQMYIPHVTASHGDSALLMSDTDMIDRARSNAAELVLIKRNEKPVGGSLIVYENRQPRLFSCGILGKDQSLLRAGIGSAIYLFSFDHLLERGFKSVHMGRSRAFLSDGALYYKQRFGYRINDVSEVGLLMRVGNNSPVTQNFLRQTGFVHCRPGGPGAALFPRNGNMDEDSVAQDKGEFAWSLGIDQLDVLKIAPTETRDDYRISKVNVAQSDS